MFRFVLVTVLTAVTFISFINNITINSKNILDEYPQDYGCIK